MNNDLNNLRESAGSWFARLRADDVSTAEHAAFDAWMKADPAHRLAYADVCAASFALEQAISGAHLRMPIVRAAPARRSGRFGAISGAVMALALAIGLWQGATPWQNLAADAYTDASAGRELTLDDGSVVKLDADSAISWDFAADGRRITLHRGAAQFSVTKDAQRPFVVQAGDVSAQALGTRYAVVRGVAQTDVAVTEGVVEVRSGTEVGVARRVEAGQGVRVDGAGKLGAVAALDPSALAWTEGRLLFSATPLEEALATLDRHLPGRVMLLARGSAQRPVTAAIPADDAASGLAALAREQGLTARSLPGLGYVVY